MHLNELLRTPIDELTFSVVDTETTGMSASFGRVIDIGIVKVRGGKIVEKWESLIDPKQPIPYWITFYTHLRDSDVSGKPVFSKIASKVQELLKESVFVGHNVGFDYSFLSEEMKRCELPFNPPRICTVQLGRKLLPQLANAHLDALSDFYNIKISARHRALPDAEATAVVLGNFLEIAKTKYHAKNFFDLERLQRLNVRRGNQEIIAKDTDQFPMLYL